MTRAKGKLARRSGVPASATKGKATKASAKKAKPKTAKPKTAKPKAKAKGTKARKTIAKVVVVNMIPRSLSGEANQDSEPTIAVNPANPLQIAGSAFTPDPPAATSRRSTCPA